MLFCDRNKPKKTSFRASKWPQKFRTRNTVENLPNVNWSLSQSNRWVATDIHLDHSSPLRKQWSPLRQVPMGDGRLLLNLKLDVLLSLLKKLSWTCCWRGWICSINLVAWSTWVWEDSVGEDVAVWRHPHRCSKNILGLFYNLVDLLLLDRKVLGWGCSGCIPSVHLLRGLWRG